MGWVKLHHKFLEWEWYGDANMVHLFIHLLLSANFKPQKWQGIEVPRGTFITSIAKLSKETGLSAREIRTCLTKLQETNEIIKKTTSRFTKITICNYDKYQDEILESDKPTTSQRQTNDKPTTQIEEYKNIINNLSIPRACAREKEEILNFYLSEKNRGKLEEFCMSRHISRDEFVRYANMVVDEWILNGKEHADEQDERDHLTRTITNLINKDRKQKNETEQRSEFSRRRGANSTTRSADDYSETL